MQIHSWHHLPFPLKSCKEKKIENNSGSCVWATGWGQKMPASVKMFCFIYRVSNALIWNAEPRIAHRPTVPLATKEAPTRTELTELSLVPAPAGDSPALLLLEENRKMLTWITLIKIRTKIKLPFKNHWLLMLIYELWRL